MIRFLILISGLLTLVYAQTWRKMPASALRQPGGSTAQLTAFCRLPASDSLHPSDSLVSPGGSHLRFQQWHSGVRIHGATVVLNQSRSGAVCSVSDASCHLPAAAGGWQTDPARLKLRYMRALGATRISVDTAWLMGADSLLPGYVLTTFQQGAVASYEIAVDARTGRELWRTDRGVHLCLPAGDTSGRGRIFLPDPLTVAATTYGSPYTDNSDQHSPAFEALMDTVVLRNITLRNGFFRLEGPYVRLKDLSAPADSVAKSANGDFFYTREQQGFEDVMVYYHIDTFQRFIQTLGFINLQNLPLSCDAHGYGTADNSQFVPDGNNSYLRFGDGGVDDGEDADVIIHEYGHALSYAAAPNTNTGFERRGLDEGVGDYLAASYSKALSNYRWADIYTWDGHNEFWGGRTTDVSYPYSPSLGDIYQVGSVWATTLMRIEARLGRNTTLRLALQELYANVGNMSLPDAARHLLDADTLLYGGIHSMVIQEELCINKLMPDSVCQLIAAAPVLQPVVSVYPNPAHSAFRVSGLVQAATLTLFDPHGRMVLQQQTREPEAEISVEALPAGLYLLRITGASAPEKGYRIMVE